MTEHDKADQARKGLIDSVKGKVKEVVGAAIGNDSLTAEGQLQQAQATQRRTANIVEAVADVDAEQARAEATDAKVDSTKERFAVNARAAAAEGSVQAQQDAQKRAVEQAGAQDAVREATQAEIDARQVIHQAKAEERENINAAAEKFADAIDDHRNSERLTMRAHEEADWIRKRAERLTNGVDPT
jgi:uncharacterized protein YjbJ (UPF0337 family)